MPIKTLLRTLYSVLAKNHSAKRSTVYATRKASSAANSAAALSAKTNNRNRMNLDRKSKGDGNDMRPISLLNKRN